MPLGLSISIPSSHTCSVDVHETMPAGIDPDLVSRLVASYGLAPALAERVVEDVLIAFGATLEEWVRSRHIRLQRQGLKNEEIYRLIAEELPARRFSAEPLSTRQIRRLIYG